MILKVILEHVVLVECGMVDDNRVTMHKEKGEARGEVI